jgi:hypothetical protein
MKALPRLAGVLLGAGLAVNARAADLKIGFISSMSGPVSADVPFSVQPDSGCGLDKRSAVVIKLEKGQWKLVP